jgi:lipopolysaccharide/colanic/teichoic acid biosynthesis glycosyltransferase
MHAEQDSTGAGLPRSAEVLLALGGLGASAPLMAGAAILVALSSRGPVLFKQRRIGRFGHPFTLYKFRTMRTGSSGPNVTAASDTRVTWIGRILRKTKLDELPELWNIVRGDLSLVGSRPEVPEYVNMDDPSWQRVLDERPGITHPVTIRLRNEEELLAAVDGDRSEYYKTTLLPFKLDGYLQYMERRTWLSDLETLVNTALVIVLPGIAETPTFDEVAAGVGHVGNRERAPGRAAHKSRENSRELGAA